MFQQINPCEMPGIGESLLNANRAIWLGRAGVQYLPGGGRIDGANARDPANVAVQWEAGTYNPILPPNMTALSSTFPYTLQAGHMLGVIPAVKSGQSTTGSSSASVNMFGSSFFGVVGYGLSANATTIVVPAAIGSEINRRLGGTGTINVIGPPTAAGTVALQPCILSSITQNSSVYWTLNLSNSVQLTAAAVAGSLLAANDGSQYPVTFIDELDGIRVCDIMGSALMVQFPRVPIAGGTVNVANLENYIPSGTTIASVNGSGVANTVSGNAMVQAWIKSMLNSAGARARARRARFMFSDTYPG